MSVTGMASCGEQKNLSHKAQTKKTNQLCGLITQQAWIRKVLVVPMLNKLNLYISLASNKDMCCAVALACQVIPPWNITRQSARTP